MADWVQLAVQVDRDLKDRVKEACREQGRTQRELVATALENELVRVEGGPEAGAGVLDAALPVQAPPESEDLAVWLRDRGACTSVGEAALLIRAGDVEVDSVAYTERRIAPWLVRNVSVRGVEVG